MAKRKLPVPSPDLQVSFYYRLQHLRALYLHEALSRTVQELDIEILDDELVAYAGKRALARVARYGLRGEVFFPVPCVLLANPFLLGYYRLLFGLSQKEFYNKGPFGRFDLQVLTIGPYLRGSENTRIGEEATREVGGLIRRIVEPYIKQDTKKTLVLENDSKRHVLIEFASDPDVRVTVKLESGVRPLVSMEIKGGGDASNIHNRLGEAEKSHLKAKGRDFSEFWTLIRVDLDDEKAREGSPTTTRFFRLDRVKRAGSAEHHAFRDELCSIIGIRSSQELKGASP